MPKSTRKTRSTTHSGKSQRVEVFIKKEEDTKTTYDNSSQHKLPATWNSQQVNVSINKEEDTKITLDSPSQQKLVTMTTLDSTVKDEDGDTKILLAKVESEKDSSILQKDKRVYCEPCNKYVYNSTNNYYYAHHLHTESHKRKVAMMLTQPDEFDPSLHCNVCDKAFGKLLCYRLHLKEVHKMELTPLKPKPDSNISPNSDNTDNHCDSCNWDLHNKENLSQALHRYVQIDYTTKSTKTNTQSKCLVRSRGPKLLLQILSSNIQQSWSLSQASLE